MIPLFTSKFFILTEPADLGINEVIILKVVDLPAPLGPNNPKIYPLSTPNELFFIATKPLSYLKKKKYLFKNNNKF